MDREESLREIAERLAVLTLSEEDLEFDFVLDQLTGLKEEIRNLSVVAQETDAALIAWLQDQHVRGMVLYSAAQSNLRTQRSLGLAAPYDPATRAGITSQFGAWAASARDEVLRRLADER
ncbi:hypothetical protein ELQ92_09250 [Labedella populi]|uniref:Uncharacterized protein n=1 Tax=Labedella populi TaxID=2498850 RepID=A0A444QB26_9MICO|nr:hypothetical protein [Labedella populi]RWZ61201.1 hypothetical protein ELQ92_09250 [Labedella populi]